MCFLYQEKLRNSVLENLFRFHKLLPKYIAKELGTMDMRALNVLLVEDDYLDAHITQKYLIQSSTHFVVTHIPDGLEAIDYLLRRKKHRNAPRPDLVLLDLRLPGMSGTEIIQFINMHEDLRSIPVIVISGETRSAQHAEHNDPYPTFVKWLGMKDFKSVVRAAEDILLQRQIITT